MPAGVQTAAVPARVPVEKKPAAENPFLKLIGISSANASELPEPQETNAAPAEATAPAAEAPKGTPTFDELLASIKQSRSAAAAPAPAPAPTASAAGVSDLLAGLKNAETAKVDAGPSYPQNPSSPAAAVAAFMKKNPNATNGQLTDYIEQAFNMPSGSFNASLQRRGVTLSGNDAYEFIEQMKRGAQQDVENPGVSFKTDPGAYNALLEGAAGIRQGVSHASSAVRKKGGLLGWLSSLLGGKNKVEGHPDDEEDTDTDPLADNAERLRAIGYWAGPGAFRVSPEGQTDTRYWELAEKYGPGLAAGLAAPELKVAQALRGMGVAGKIGAGALTGAAQGAGVAAAQGHYRQGDESFEDAARRDITSGAEGGAIVGGGLSAAGQIAKPIIQKVTGEVIPEIAAREANKEAQGAFNAARDATRTAAANTVDPRVQMLQNAITRLGINTPRGRAAQSALDDLANARGAGETVRASGTAEAAGRKIEADALYDNVRQLAGTQPIVANSAAKGVQDLAALMSKSSRLADDSPRGAQVLQAMSDEMLQPTANGGVAARAVDPQKLMSFYSELGSVLRDLKGNAPKGAPISPMAAEITRLRNAVGQDLENGLSPDAAKAWREANEFYNSQVVPYNKKAGKFLSTDVNAQDSLAQLWAGSEGLGKEGGKVAQGLQLLSESGKAAARDSFLDHVARQATALGKGFDVVAARNTIAANRNAVNVLFPGSQKFLIDGFIKAANTAEALSAKAHPSDWAGKAMMIGRHAIIPTAAGGGALYYTNGRDKGAVAAAAAAGLTASMLLKYGLVSQAGRNIALQISGVKNGEGKAAESLTMKLIGEGARNAVTMGLVGGRQSDQNNALPALNGQEFDLPMGGESADDGMIDLPGAN